MELSVVFLRKNKKGNINFVPFSEMFATAATSSYSPLPPSISSPAAAVVSRRRKPHTHLPFSSASSDGYGYGYRLLLSKRRKLVVPKSHYHFSNNSFISTPPLSTHPFRHLRGGSRTLLNPSLVATNPPSPSLGDDDAAVTPQPQVEVQTSIWNWKGYNIRYQYAGSNGPALVLVHGFGANSDHWRKNMPVLAQSHRVFGIDLIGYGYSDKPNPEDVGVSAFYTFETWANQLNDFCVDVVKDEVFVVCNSIGGIVGLQAAVTYPNFCRGLVLLNISLRMLHIKKQPWYGKPLIRSFQNLLRYTPIGKYFYRSVATPKAVKSILCRCYHDTSQVTEELVEAILLPGLEAGAADVFLEFICYSGGPLPEELLPQVKVPVLVAWGDKDPWEPIELGRAYANFDSVEEFVVLPNVGHCPQDEAPHLVNPLVQSFVARHQLATSSITTPV